MGLEDAEQRRGTAHTRRGERVANPHPQRPAHLPTAGGSSVVVSGWERDVFSRVLHSVSRAVLGHVGDDAEESPYGVCGPRADEDQARVGAS